jgi:enolase
VARWWEERQGPAGDAWYSVVSDRIYDEEPEALAELRDAYALGFITTSNSPDERADMRNKFFDILDDLGINSGDFDWEAWRDYYESTAA